MHCFLPFTSFILVISILSQLACLLQKYVQREKNNLISSINMIVSKFYYCSFDLLTQYHIIYIETHHFQAALHKFFLVNSILFEESETEYKPS